MELIIVCQSIDNEVMISDNAIKTIPWHTLGQKAYPSFLGPNHAHVWPFINSHPCDNEIIFLIFSSETVTI